MGAKFVSKAFSGQVVLIGFEGCFTAMWRKKSALAGRRWL